jgi:hypothetical protein
MTPDFSIRFPKSEVAQWANCYSYTQGGDDDGRVLEIGERSRRAGYYTRDDFLEVCEWKTRGRPRRHYQQNSEEDVRRVTTIALSIADEKTRIWALVAPAPGLIGVQMPTASALLHLASADPRSPLTAGKAYPIIDFRALWSLNWEKNRRDTFKFWWAYVQACRALAVECGVSMRDLDRALWEYSNQNQKKEKKACGEIQGLFSTGKTRDIKWDRIELATFEEEEIVKTLPSLVAEAFATVNEEPPSSFRVGNPKSIYFLKPGHNPNELMRDGAWDKLPFDEFEPYVEKTGKETSDTVYYRLRKEYL